MDYESQRAERDFRQNPPDGAPGQGNDDGWGDIFGSDSNDMGTSDMSSMGGMYDSDINSMLNGDINGTGGVNMQQTQGTNKKNPEDVFFEGITIAGKGVWSYFKIMFNSLKNNTKGDWHRLGVRIVKVSIASGIVGTVFCILKPFLKSNNSPIDLVIGSLMAMSVGVCFSMFFNRDTEAKQSDIPVESSGMDDSFGASNDWGNDFDDSFGDSFEAESPKDDFEDNDWGDILDDEGDDWDPNESIDLNVNSSDFSVQDALNSVSEIQQGTQTREYLFETFMKVLPKMNPGYHEMQEISPDENEFYDFENMLREAAFQVGTKEESVPELLKLYENDFLYSLSCSRPAGLKEQQIADEIANTFARDEMNRLVRHGCYASVETSVGKYTINIFKGVKQDSMGNQVGGVKISLGDIYTAIKDFVRNPSIEIPFVWGVNEFGDTLYCDMIDNNSIIVSGEPRGGKSWKGQSIITQMAMFHSPEEIEFYIFDGKNDASDYKYMSTVLPHIKYFCGDMDKINEGIDKVIDMMVNVRGKIMADDDSDGTKIINIKDYNKRHPDKKLPYTYIVVDELMSLMNHYKETDQKEEAVKFKSNLSTMISKLPYTGLRFILFPHRIVNDIIEKNSYSLVSCRSVVNMLDTDEIKRTMNVTEKTFPYKLVQKGDMALRLKEIAGGETVYCHAEMLSNDNSGNQRLFEYVGGVWKKLCPSCECITINGMIGGHIDSGYSSGVAAKESKKKSPTTSKPARDNTKGEDSFEYSGFGEGTSIEDEVEYSEMNSKMDDIPDAESDFWDSF